MSNLYTVWTHPHNTTNVKDESATNAVANVVLPLHRPHFCIFGAKGPVNTIDWYTGVEARNTFGQSTFNRDSEFWDSEKLYLTQAVFPNQGCFITRLADEKADPASLVLYVGTWEKEVPVYNDLGELTTDKKKVKAVHWLASQLPYTNVAVQETDPVTGESVEAIDEETGEVRTYRSYIAINKVKPIAANVTFSEGEDTSTTTKTESVTFYPIVAVKYDSVGKWGNRAGFRFLCNADDQDSNVVHNLQALLYTFAPVEKPYGSDTPEYLGTVYDQAQAKFMFKTGAYDNETYRKMSANDTIFRLYTEADSIKNLLPYSVYFYEDNAGLVGKELAKYMLDQYVANNASFNFETKLINDIISYNKNDEYDDYDSFIDLSDTEATAERIKYLINICSLTDSQSNNYKYAVLDTDAEVAVVGIRQDDDSVDIPAGYDSITEVPFRNPSLNDAYTNYLTGGSDGDTSRTKFEALYRSFLSFKLNPELQDYMHYPITHLYDVGYSNPTKFKMIDFMAQMPNTKLTLASQQVITESGVEEDLYDLEASMSNGIVLRDMSVLTPESELYGTQACRAEIFSQSGHLTDKNISDIVPFTFWLCLKRCELQNASYFKGDIGPDPNNRVTQFRDFNFIPYSRSQKEQCWKNSLNYCEYGRMDRLFYAGTQSVYRNKTSILNDIWFTDAVVYLKYIIDWTWADTANAKMPLASLSQLVVDKITSAASSAFGNKYTLSECSFYQTEEEALLGTTFHVRTVLLGDSPNLIWNSDIIVRRSNLDSSQANA